MSTMDHGGGAEREQSCLQKLSGKIIETLEGGFGNLGLMIGKYPMRFMIGSVILSLLPAIGLLEFYEESEPDVLWVPEGAKLRDNKAWVDKNFPYQVDYQWMIGTSDNILKAQQIQALFDVYQESTTMESSSGYRLADICIKAGSVCVLSGILEVWSYDQTTIQALTDAQVLADIKSTTVSPMYNGKDIDYTSILGHISYDSITGDIIGAKAAFMTWQTEDTSETYSWEDRFIALGRRGHSDLSNLYVWAGKSPGVESEKAIQSDVLSLTIGYTLVLCFVLFVLGKFNCLEQKAWLTLGGIISVGLSILISIGLSSALQQFYGPVQSVLPFLLLGLGVDDMFVIMGALSNLTPAEQDYDVPEKISAVLRHAGVSITVTSLTDFVAFLIGATTIIPALRSFCIYAAIGIIALYFLQTVFFTSCLAIDLSRTKQNRNACCFMYKHGDDYRPNKCSQKEFIPYVFKNGMASLITKLPFKIIVIIIFLALVSCNIYGLVNLENYFDRDAFLPFDSYASAFTRAQRKYFPSTGDPGHIYCGNIDYFGHKTELQSLGELMDSNNYIVNGTTDSWFEALNSWLSTTTDTDIIAMLDPSKYPTTDANFVNLTYRLTTEQATRTSSYLRFDSSSLDIIASRFPLTHVVTKSSNDEVRVMDSAYAIAADAGFSSSECFPFAFAYLTWETNKIIQEELYRNIGAAMACVFLVSLILIANLVTSIFVFIGVIATLINVAGTMYFWGLTIDTVTSIILILSVGLSVDYSAHIGHMFMSVKGTREDRVKETIGTMGPSVFYGGFSTFLAFVLLANSNSYIFLTFFKLNFLTVLYGLFHGLVFLPVMLSLFGPAPYPNASLVYQNRNLGNKVNNGEGGVENPAFVTENKKVDITNLSTLPPKEDTYIDNKKGVDYSLPPSTSRKQSHSSDNDTPPPAYSNVGPTTVQS